MENDKDRKVPTGSPAVHTPPPPQVMDPSAHPGTGINKDYSKEKHPEAGVSEKKMPAKKNSARRKPVSSAKKKIVKKKK